MSSIQKIIRKSYPYFAVTSQSHNCVAHYTSKNILMIKFRKQRIYFTKIIYKINDKSEKRILKTSEFHMEPVASPTHPLLHVLARSMHKEH